MIGLLLHSLFAAEALAQYAPGTSKPSYYPGYKPATYQQYQPATTQPTTRIVGLPRYSNYGEKPVFSEAPAKAAHPLDGAMATFAQISFREQNMVFGIHGIRHAAGEIPKYQNNVVTSPNLSESVMLLQEAYQRVLGAHSSYKVAMKEYRSTLPTLPSSFQRAADHYQSLSRDPAIPEFVRNNYAKLAINCENGLAAAKARAEQYEAMDKEIFKTMEQAKHVEKFLGNYERYLRLFPAHDPGKERAALLAELKVFIQGFAEFQKRIDTIVEPPPSEPPLMRPVVSNVK